MTPTARLVAAARAFLLEWQRNRSELDILTASEELQQALLEVDATPPAAAPTDEDKIAVYNDAFERAFRENRDEARLVAIRAVFDLGRDAGFDEGEELGSRLGVERERARCVAVIRQMKVDAETEGYEGVMAGLQLAADALEYDRG